MKMKYIRITPKGLKAAADANKKNVIIPENQDVITLDNVSTEGYYLTVLDSTEEQTVWHRITSDMDMRVGGKISVHYFASDEKRDLTDQTGDVDFQSLLKEWQRIDHPEDALFIQAKGRYLFLLIRFYGSKGASPCLRSMKVIFPRFTFLEYLPSVYGNEGESKDFLERFLSLFGSFYFDLEEQIDRMTSYLDPDSTEEPFLRWLGTWLGLHDRHDWKEETLRTFLKEAPSLYKKRGTKSAIERIVEIYTGKKPIIVEYFQYSSLAEKTKYYGLYGNDPFAFCIIVDGEDLSPYLIAGLEKLLEEEKPLFTKAKLIILKPMVRLDAYCYLGMNSKIFGESPTQFVMNYQIAVNTYLI